MYDFMSLYADRELWRHRLELTEDDMVPPPARPTPRLGGLDVAVRTVTKSFGDKLVLRDLSITVRAGESVAIVGRSGCGKSTLLRLIAGLDQPTSGQILFGDDRHVRATTDVRVMFQEPRLLPWASILDNVVVGLGGAGDAAWRLEQARTALTSVGLADRAGEFPAVLSGGQKQRVALARALVSGPGILALDEPLGALDALTRIEMQSLLEGVWLQRCFTAILVTHDVTEAIALADRVVLIEGGQIAMDVEVALPRPRQRGNPAFAALEGTILDRLLTSAVRAA